MNSKMYNYMILFCYNGKEYHYTFSNVANLNSKSDYSLLRGFAEEVAKGWLQANNLMVDGGKLTSIRLYSVEECIYEEK